MKCDFCGQEIEKPAFVDHNGVTFCDWCYRGTFEDSLVGYCGEEREDDD